jgi:hypothetical protein
MPHSHYNHKQNFMKTIYLLLAMIFLSKLTIAQAVDYKLGILNEYGNFTMMVGEKEDIKIYNADDMTAASAIDDKFEIMINGHSISAANPEEGIVHINLLGEVSFEAPAHIPSTNPVSLAFSFISPKDHKSKIILVANITIVAGYKLTADMDVKVQDVTFNCTGIAYLKLKQLEDKSYILSPFHGKDQLDIKINKYEIPKVQYLDPMKYSTPIFVSISSDKNDPQCKIYFHAINQISQTLEADGKKIVYPSPEPFLSYLNNIFLSGKNGIEARGNETLGNQQANLDWAQRMHDYQTDPKYKNSAQAKADIAKMKSLQQQMNVASGPSASQKMTSSSVFIKSSFHFKNDVAFSVEKYPSYEVMSVAQGSLKISIQYLH